MTAFIRWALLFCALAVITGPGSADEQAVDWLPNYRAALTQAKATGKPLLVEFRCEA